jgi:SulP family sulfate permease
MKYINSIFNIKLGDLLGGISGAAVALPQSMGLGIVLFTIMGYNTSTGALAGMIGATVLLFVSGGIGATKAMISAPNGPMTMMLAGVMGTLSAQGLNSDIMALNLSAILVTMGIFQIIFSLIGGAKLIKYIPYPVVAGLVSGVGILMVKSQINMLSNGWEGLFPSSIQNFYPVIIAILTMIAMYIVPILSQKKIPGAVGGLVVGITLFYTILQLLPINMNMDWVVGEIPSIANIHFGISLNDIALLSPKLIISTALALTILGTTDSLVTSLVADSRTGEHHNSKMETLAQGIAEILIGLLGALGGWGTKGATLVTIEAGGRRFAPIVAGLFFLVLMLFAAKVGEYLPVSVLAGIVAMVGIGMIDINIFSWIRYKRTRMDALTALSVIAVIISVNLVAAVGVGVFISILLFISMQTKNPIIHRKVNGKQHRSVSKRTKEENSILDKYGDEIVLYELKGNLFFATADKLRLELNDELKQNKLLILHFRRVGYIDMSAMIVLLQIGEDAKKKGCELIFCHLHKGLGFGKKVSKAFKHIDSKRVFNHTVFPDSDTAFEYAEDKVLQLHGYELNNKEGNTSIEENDLCINIPDNYAALINTNSKRRELAKKTVLFNAGDYGDSIFMVLKGSIEIRLNVGEKGYKRLAKYKQGTFFGEVSLVNPGPRSASAIAIEDCIVAELSKDNLDKIEKEINHELLIVILKRISIRLSNELRRSAVNIERLEQW